MKDFVIKYHNFIKENTWGYKIAILVSFWYALFLGIIIYTTSVKPFLYQMQFNCVMFLAFLSVQFILSISHFSLNYSRKAV